LAREAFPVADPAYLVAETEKCVVQVNGKKRAILEVDPAISAADLQAAAMADPGVVRALAERPVVKAIVRAPKLVSLVV
jgi:leucyl-tRNA synthetase